MEEAAESRRSLAPVIRFEKEGVRLVVQNSGNSVVNSGWIGNITQTQGAPSAAPAGTPAPDEGTPAYDVALSYAGEQAKFVARVAKLLEAENLRVFFAPYREGDFIGEDMYARFYRIYRYESRYVAAFVTTDYLSKEITMHEAATAMLRGRDEKRNCLIPIYFGGASLPNLDPDINYIPADGLREVEVADKIRNVIRNSGR